MPFSSEEIWNRFNYHAASEEGKKRHHELSDVFKLIAEAVERVCPDGREKSLVFTKLEEAKMWASAAVARNPETR